MLTTREIVFKWLTISFFLALLLFVYDLTFGHLRLLGVSMFLPPLLVAVVASLEETRTGVIFGIVLGFLTDLMVTGLFPCVYTVSFTISALFSSLLAKSVLKPGLLCSFAASVLTFVITDLFNMLALIVKAHSPLLDMLDLAWREMFVSLLLLPACSPLITRLHRRFNF